MRNILRVSVFLVLAVSLTLNIPQAKACSCVQPEAPAVALEKARAVFSGRVIDIDNPVDGADFTATSKVTLEVSRVWKGIKSSPVHLSTSGSSASCGYAFAEGKEYLVYAYDDEGKLGTGLCTRTALLSDAGEDLTALGAGEMVEPTDGDGDSEDTYAVVGGMILIIAVASVVYFARATKAGKKI